MMEIRPVDETNRGLARSIIRRSWGGDIIVSRLRTHKVDELRGYLAYIGGAPAGLVTYAFQYGECEIVTLDSLVKNRGAGTALIEKVFREAKKQGSLRLWLITTNDNTHAMAFYKKRGFSFTGIHYMAEAKARAIKPQIPLKGNGGMPILHEYEYEILL